MIGSADHDKYIEVKMPAQRAILHDILVSKLDPSKKHADLSKSGNLRQVDLFAEKNNEDLFLSKTEVTTLEKEKQEPVVEQLVTVDSFQEEAKEELIEQTVEKVEETVSKEEKPKKKQFQKKKSKDNVIL